jgi:hypothetical protein
LDPHSHSGSGSSADQNQCGSGSATLILKTCYFKTSLLHFRPVQEFLELPLDYEREQNTLARLLPDPLYVLFIQVKCEID